MQKEQNENPVVVSIVDAKKKLVEKECNRLRKELEKAEMDLDILAEEIGYDTPMPKFHIVKHIPEEKET